MKMKLETAVVIAKLFCVFAGTALLTLQTGLGQWSHNDNDPTPVQWVMVIGGSLGTGLTAAGAFLSNAFGNYMNGININGNSPIVPSNKPPVTNSKLVLTEAKKDDTLPPVVWHFVVSDSTQARKGLRKFASAQQMIGREIRDFSWFQTIYS